MQEKEDLLRGLGFKRTKIPQTLGKEGFVAVIKEDSVVITAYTTDERKKFLYTETYFNMQNLKRDFEKTSNNLNYMGYEIKR